MESCKICIYDPKASESYFLKYIKLGLFPTDTAPYISFSGNQALQSHYMNISRGSVVTKTWNDLKPPKTI